MSWKSHQRFCHPSLIILKARNGDESDWLWDVKFTWTRLFGKCYRKNVKSSLSLINLFVSCCFLPVQAWRRYCRIRFVNPSTICFSCCDIFITTFCHGIKLGWGWIMSPWSAVSPFIHLRFIITCTLIQNSCNWLFELFLPINLHVYRFSCFYCNWQGRIIWRLCSIPSKPKNATKKTLWNMAIRCLQTTTINQLTKFLTSKFHLKD